MQLDYLYRVACYGDGVEDLRPLVSDKNDKVALQRSGMVVSYANGDLCIVCNLAKPVVIF